MNAQSKETESGSLTRQSPGIYAAPWGVTLKIVTTGVILLLVVAVLGAHAAGMDGPRQLAALIAVAFGAILAGMAFGVRGYQVGAGTVAILRPGWRTRIALAGLRSVDADPRLLSGSLRLFGNGGFFSFTGWYWNRRLGRYRAFLNDANRTVVLTFPDRRVALGPDHPQRFVAHVRSEAGLG